VVEAAPAVRADQISRRGQLRVYLGAAPGVGKTYAMLEEAHRRKSRGTDVVIALLETHGRKRTADLVGDLEIVPRRTVRYRGAAFAEMDVRAVLARRPQVAVVDELAHTNVPGSRNAKRWQDVQDLLEAGITVLSTVNIQHLESLNDVVDRITGTTQRETVPDAVVRRADQVELMDMTPEALRRRMVHGNVYSPDRVDAALGNYFRVGNLTALRELALLWLADKVDEQLDRYRAEHHIDETWEARERVVVALTGGPEGETLIRRGARIAARSKGADLLAVHVARSDGLAGADPALLARQRLLVETLGGTYHQVVGPSIPDALLDFARAVNATQLVLGASRRRRLAQILSPGVGVTTTARSGPIDVHLVSHEQIGRGWRRPLLAGTSALSPRRRLAGFALTLLGLPLLTIALHDLRDDLTLSSIVLLYLVVVVAAALAGALWPALLAAVGGFLLLNFFFTEPYHTLVVNHREDLVAVLVFLLVAIAVSAAVDLAARRTRDAATASAQASTLAAVAGSVLRGSRPLPALLERLQETFALDAVTLLERREDAPPGPDDHANPTVWRIAATVGGPPCAAPADCDVVVPVDDDLVLALRGRPLPATDQRIVEAFAARAAVALRQERLAEQAARAHTLEEADRMRTALLAAVSYDLRRPLAAAGGAVARLRSQEVAATDADRGELLAAADESLDRLARLVDDLLDLSRLQAGDLAVTTAAVWLDEAVPTALAALGAAGSTVTVDLPDDLPALAADPDLLKRVLVNLIGNALRSSPPDRPPFVSASPSGRRVEVRVADHGSGVPADRHEQVFHPLQRLGGGGDDSGAGLGLALSRGLTEAMAGTLSAATSPGGGLTMVLTLPISELPDPGAAAAAEAADRAIAQGLSRPSGRDGA
jgi:two-component system, OmpR family, sensor histidine kinase KdpD